MIYLYDPKYADFIQEIKSIPVERIAQKYGIKLEKKHRRLWGCLRDEKTASFSINLECNLWYDFGAAIGGSGIDLVAVIEGISPAEAIEKLASEYNISYEPERTKGWKPLTDSQYRELGIEPERATMNFNFDLRVHTKEQLTRWSNKYGIPVHNLADKFPDVYNRLVFKIGKKTIDSIRNAYFTKLKFALDTSISSSQRILYKKWAELDAKDINSKVDLLFRSIFGNFSLADIIKSLRVDPIRDFKYFSIQQGITTQKGLSYNEIVNKSITEIPKDLSNLKLSGYVPQDFNFNLSVAESNRPLIVKEVKGIYKVLGSSIQKYEEDYTRCLNDGLHTENLQIGILLLKDLFNKCSLILEGVRDMNLTRKYDNEIHNVLEKSAELSK